MNEPYGAKRTLLRAAAICGLLVPATFVVGLVLGDLAQPDAFSPADDDISYLGALTANKPWLYNQLASNVCGLLILGLAVGLWRALGPGWLARLGVAGLAAAGFLRFLEGFLRLDCRSIDAGCVNDSWHSHAHKIESGVFAALFFIVPPVLAFAFRRLPEWRSLWLPTLLLVPVLIIAGVLMSIVGNGASTRATSILYVLWLALIAFRLLRVAGPEFDERATRPAAASGP